ncbi:hypothetical protein BFP72_10190 [Reichenbachiella sp. 5M10]|uniref:hybrid sensor histidine kinase/response regulator transcription factor n=1 Tax=Reichenbachiella sp. 5M10 TaxID=1889772 RepID=UPI000C151466|nr:hybrid sensor histidine kinase/response regulator transcription factor [Reichenbachiella sp. 5M10]PIB35735.1 hypothetical protein BFP72_10190 [Reichenbachiella sp. 5M10]
MVRDGIWKCARVLVLLLAWGQAMAGGEQNKYVFNSIHEGMSKRAVTSFSQDAEGFIWISTFGGGLYRYDGLDYVLYDFKWNDSTSINSNVIYRIYHDSRGTMWVATDNGVCRFNKKTDSFERLTIQSKGEDLSNLTYLTVEEMADHSILFTSGYYGLFKHDPITKQTEVIPIQNRRVDPLFIRDIVRMPDGTIYLASSYGILEYDTQNNLLIEAEFLGGERYFGLELSVESFCLHSSGDLWVGTQYDGVYRMHLESNKGRETWQLQKIPITNKRILSMVEDTDGSMLIGTENDGLWVIDPLGRVIQDFYYDKFEGGHIKANSIWALYRDRDERIWLGYYDKAVGVYDPNYDKFDQLLSQANNLNSLQVGSVTGIVEDEQGKYWIGMDGGGVDIYDPRTGMFEHTLGANPRIKGMKNKAVQAILMDDQQQLWAGSWEGGLFYLPHGGEQFVHYNLLNAKGEEEAIRIISIDQDQQGRLWIGTFGHGILSFDPSTKEFETYLGEDFSAQELVNADVRKILVCQDSSIWAGTTRGLYKLTKKAQGGVAVTCVRLSRERSEIDHTSTNHILSLYEDTKGFLWIGTDGGGLCKYDRARSEFKWYSQANGLSQETISGILEDDQGVIWVSGQAGLSSIDPQTNEIKQYTVHDGLLSNAFNFNAAYKDDQGQLLFGNYVGIDYFNPKDLITNAVKPKVYLTELRLFNELVSPGQDNEILTHVISQTDQITLTPDQTVFTIQFVGLNYTRPEENEYAFYLEGLESDWNYVGNKRTATYTSLKSGEYVFKVKAANNDGVWSEEVRTLRITVLPPWWRTTVAFMIYLGTFLSLLYLFFKVVQIRVRDKQAVLTAVENRKREEELNDKKIQFFTNISHEFRTPLTLIINPLRDVLQDDQLTLPPRVQDKLSVMYRNSDRLKRLIDELMDFRKLKFNKLAVRVEYFEIEEAIRSICGYFQEEAISKQIDLEVVTNPTDQWLWLDKGMLEKIMFNLLSNAFKVTPQRGSISVETTLLSHTYEGGEVFDSFRIRVKDTGPGLDADQLDKIFERFYQVNKKNKDYFGGTGIGLEVVKDFIFLNKGDIRVESQVGVGTTFEIFFRLGEEHFEETDKVQAQSVDQVVDGLSSRELVNRPERTVESTGRVKKTVLVVEDNTELRKYLRDELSIDFKVLVAKDGLEGWEIASKELPDVIITDVVMPERTGTELCAQIKENLNTSHIPVVMLTAKSSIDEQLEGINQGADAYITKPFDMRLVLSQLAQLIQSREKLFKKYFQGMASSEEVNTASSLDKDFIQKLLQYVHENLSKTDLSVEALAEELNLSRSQLYRKVKAMTGNSVNEFTRNVRLEQAHKLIAKGNTNISEVSYTVGFSSPSYFTKCFKEHFGHLPTDTPRV